MGFYPLLFHVIACLWYIFFLTNYLLTIYEQSDKWDDTFDRIQDMGYRYLSNWNLIMQTSFFIGCLFHDVMKMLNGPNWLNFGSKFQIFLSYSFSSILLPLGLYINISFWFLFNVNREFVYPKLIDTYVPFWYNHGMHTIIVPLLLFELITTRHEFPPVMVSFKILVRFIFVYAVVFAETCYEKGQWMYPMYALFSLPVSLAILAVMIAVIIACLFVGIFFQNMYWGKEGKKEHRNPVKKLN